MPNRYGNNFYNSQTVNYFILCIKEVIKHIL